MSIVFPAPPAETQSPPLTSDATATASEAAMRPSPRRRRGASMTTLPIPCCAPRSLVIVVVVALLCLSSPRPTSSFSPAAAAAAGRAAGAVPSAFDPQAATVSTRTTEKSRTEQFQRLSALAAAAAADGDGDVDASSSDGEEEQQHKQLNIAFVTGNAMKAREIELILREHGATCGPTPDDPSMVNLRMLNVDLPEIQEINTEAIAKNKAIQGAQLAGGPCVVEDTSLQFTALGGMPGPFIKWFQQTLRSEGLYKILHGYDDKSATAVCTLAFCSSPHADPVVFTGVTRGKIVEPVEGRGFGWDSIFVPDGETEPFSCMSTEEKCKLSHRGRAVRRWADWLGMNQAELWERQGGRPAVGHKGLDFKAIDAEE